MLLAALFGCGQAMKTTAAGYTHASVGAPLLSRSQHFVAWHPDCEAALNKQIAVETAASFQYLAMYAYFDRPTVALKQAASFFEKAQAEEIGHAKAFIKYQNTRGGTVVLQQI